MRFFLFLVFSLPTFCFLTAANSSFAQEKIEQFSLPEGAYDYSKVPEEYIDESRYIYSHCNKVPGLNVKYDCQCYAEKFLSKRIDAGKEMSQNNILHSIRSECNRNIIGSAALEYQSCMSIEFDTKEYISDAVTQEDYCQCVGKKMEESYKNLNPNTVSSKARQEFIFQANMRCRSKDMYPDLL